jgi:polar amino acid transport system substrate-binding protein
MRKEENNVFIRHKVGVIVVTAVALVGSLAIATQATGASAAPPKKKVLTTKQINAMLPPEIRQKGVLTIATSAALAPSTYLKADGQTIVGYAPDVVTAMAKAAGLRVEFVKTTFAGILTGIQAGRYDGGIIFRDTKEREEQANILGFLNSGDSWVVRSNYSGPAGAPCGQSVAAGAGSAEALLLPDLSKSECVAKGKQAMDIHIFPNNPTAIIALTSNRVDAVLSSTDVGGYSVQRSNGTIKLWGKQIESTVGLTGMALPKQPLSLAKALRVACSKLVANGSLTGILKTWGVGPQKVKNCYINGVSAGIKRG